MKTTKKICLQSPTPRSQRVKKNNKLVKRGSVLREEAKKASPPDLCCNVFSNAGILRNGQDSASPPENQRETASRRKQNIKFVHTHISLQSSYP